MAKINCQVHSCTYHGKDDICQADSIMVKNNSHQGFEMEIGVIGGEDEAGTSAQTMCETFKPHQEQKSK